MHCLHPFRCFQAFPPGLTLLVSTPPTPLPSHLSEASGPLCQDRHHPRTHKQKTSPWRSLPQLLQVAGKTFPAAANTKDPKASCNIGSKSGQGSSNGLGQTLSESIPTGPGPPFCRVSGGSSRSEGLVLTTTPMQGDNGKGRHACPDSLPIVCPVKKGSGIQNLKTCN